MKTYAIAVKYVRPNLVLHVLFGGLLWVNLPVRRNEEVSWLFSLSIEMCNIEFEGADFGKLLIVTVLETPKGSGRQRVASQGPAHSHKRR